MTEKQEDPKVLASANSRTNLGPTMPCAISMVMKLKAVTYELTMPTESSYGPRFPADHFVNESIMNVEGNVTSQLKLLD